MLLKILRSDKAKDYKQIPLLLILLTTLLQVQIAESHGRLEHPRARNTLWREDNSLQPEYDDNGLFCGGFDSHWVTNNGKCGVCGDDWSLPAPRPHDDNGVFGFKRTTATYFAGQDIDIEATITANHRGSMYIKLCEKNGNKMTTPDCFKRTLPFVNPNGTLSHTFPIIHELQQRTYKLTVRLPSDVTCTRCVLQWTYRTGNRWNFCPDGSGALGCGQQETFVNCADVEITPKSDSNTSNSNAGSAENSILGNGETYHAPPQNRWKTYYRKNPSMGFVRDFSKKGHPFIPYVIKSEVCVAKGKYRNNPDMNHWCTMLCMNYDQEITCPKDKCQCFTRCEALPPFNKVRGSREHCEEKCLNSRSKCPTHKCHCF